MKLNRGSLTVEAAIIIPIVLLMTVAILYTALIQYETAVIYREAEYASTNIALYDNPLYIMNNIYDIDLNKGMEDYPLYWQLFNKPDSAVHEAYIKSHLEETLLLPADVTVNVGTEGFIVNKKVVVDITVDYTKAVGNFLNNFGMESMTKRRVVSKQNLRNSSEFIRNYDMVSNFVMNIERVKEFKTMLEEKTEKLTGKVTEGYEGGVNTTTDLIDKLIGLLESI